MKLFLIFTSAIVFNLAVLSQCKKDYRLPDAVWPSRYLIEITPYFEAKREFSEFSFEGNVIITLSTKYRSVKEIVLHNSGLEILYSNSKIYSASASESDNSLKIESIDSDPLTEMNTFVLSKELIPGREYNLSVSFHGNMSSKSTGFYKSSYIEGNETRWLAVTQFEPIYARKAFPCFDEPQFKAKFILIVNRPVYFKPSVSNMRIDKTEIFSKQNRIRETFKETPKMSSYLLAYLISEFDVRENESKRIDIYSRPDDINKTSYGLQIAEKGLKILSEIFDYDYFSVSQVEKLSLVALEEFEGAMENWGIITFREKYILHDESTSLIDRNEIIETIVHEEAHQWFGNLVTCDWWSYAWLNEGFATYFSRIVAGLIEKEYKTNEILISKCQKMLWIEFLSSEPPLTREVNTPGQIQDSFDKISYEKGSCVIRMMDHLTEKSFIEGLKFYFKENEFKTVTPDHLFSALQKYMNYNMSSMIPWTTQSGYPVVTIEVSDDRRSLSISQKQFQLQHKNNDNAWNIPLNYATSDENSNFSDTTYKMILSGNETINITFPNEIDWIVFNVQQTGYYRVNYDEETWSRISKALINGKIDVLNRAQIVDDSLNLALAGIISYELAYNNIRFLINETHPLPIESARIGFDGIERRTPNKFKIFKELNTARREKLQPEHKFL